MSRAAAPGATRCLPVTRWSSRGAGGTGQEAAVVPAQGRSSPPPTTAALTGGPVLALGWDAVAAVYTGWLAFVLLRPDAEHTARRATVTDPDRVSTDVALLAAAIASLVTVGFVLTRAGRVSATELAQVGLGMLSVVLSWALVHPSSSAAGHWPWPCPPRRRPDDRRGPRARGRTVR